MNTSMVRKPGFSLVELVVVVIVIGVIAAIAGPRVSRASKGSADAAVRANLASLRNAIDRYAGEHDGAWPGADGTESTLIDQLIKKTDAGGNVGDTSGVHIFGPHLRSGFPPITVGPNLGATGVTLKKDDPLKTYEGDKDSGWVYNYETGEIIANTDDLDDDGVGYDTY